MRCKLCKAKVVEVSGIYFHIEETSCPDGIAIVLKDKKEQNEFAKGFKKLKWYRKVIQKLKEILTRIKFTRT